MKLSILIFGGGGIQIELQDLFYLPHFQIIFESLKPMVESPLWSHKFSEV